MTKVWDRALLVVGAVALAVGLANVLFPGGAFPSSLTCVTDWDTVLCDTAPWPPGPWLVLLGALAVGLAITLLRQPVATGEHEADATR